MFVGLQMTDTPSSRSVQCQQ